MVDRRRSFWFNKAFNKLFNAWFRFRKGTPKFRGAATCIVHTTGARTGKARQTPLLVLPVGDGTFAVVGSNGGDDRTPAWVHNLKAQPAVELEMDGRRLPMSAAIADAATRATLWPRLVAMYGSYDSYQRKTDREIPVILLTPRAT